MSIWNDDNYEIAKRNIYAVIEHEGAQYKVAKLIDIPISTFSTQLSSFGNNKKISEALVKKICDWKDFSEERFFTESLRGTNLDNIFDPKYKAYFGSTKRSNSKKIDVAELTIELDSVKFSINLSHMDDKRFTGKIIVEADSICIELLSEPPEKYRAYIVLPYLKKNTAHRKYVGGMGVILLMSDKNTFPCAHRIILSQYAYRLSEPYVKEEFDFIHQNLFTEPNDHFIKVNFEDNANVVDDITNRLIHEKSRNYVSLSQGKI